MFKTAFIQIVQDYNSDQLFTERLWYDITLQYLTKNRHYHNLNHLEHLYQLLITIKEKIHDWDTLIFSIAYHDIIYNVRRNDNEEQSATYAEKELNNIS